MQSRIFNVILDLKSYVHLRELIYTSLQKYSYVDTFYELWLFGYMGGDLYISQNHLRWTLQTDNINLCLPTYAECYKSKMRKWLQNIDLK